MATETGMVAGAVALARALGGADVTLETPIDPEVAEALGREITAGLGAEPGPPWRVVAVTVRGDPPGVGAIKITISAEPPADAAARGLGWRGPARQQ